MENQTLNALEYYKQSKQRVDIDIDFQNKKILGKTNLTFLLKEETKSSKLPETLILKLNSDNMIVKSTNILLYSNSNTNNLNVNSNTEFNNNKNIAINNNANIFTKKNSSIAIINNNNNNNNIISLANPNLISNNNTDNTANYDINSNYNNTKNISNLDYNNTSNLGNFNNTDNDRNFYNNNNNNENQQTQTVKKLKFTYINPENYTEYLKSLYNCVEDSESIKNLNRIEWENKIDGSLIIEIPYSYLVESSMVAMSDEQNTDKVLTKLQEKFKITIEYELYTNYAGIVFQNFYDEKIDSEYDVCYTPNFVLLTICFFKINIINFSF